jgi:DNA-binding transcriptional LysR family regulator
VSRGNIPRRFAVTLQQLTYFLAAAEYGSFTAAADALHLARPSVSEQIAHLEDELGVSLFVRAGRRLELTDAGRLLRPEAERTLAVASSGRADTTSVLKRMCDPRSWWAAKPRM